MLFCLVCWLACYQVEKNVNYWDSREHSIKIIIFIWAHRTKFLQKNEAGFFIHTFILKICPLRVFPYYALLFHFMRTLVQLIGCARTYYGMQFWLHNHSQNGVLGQRSAMYWGRSSAFIIQAVIPQACLLVQHPSMATLSVIRMEYEYPQCTAQLWPLVMRVQVVWNSLWRLVIAHWNLIPEEGKH